ncbi:hypothetical protein Tco_1172913 [Tanacetum coccineum]
MLLYSWDGGLDVYVDLTGSSPLTQTGMVYFVPGRAVIDAAQRKRDKYMAKCAAIGYGFLPFSLSSLRSIQRISFIGFRGFITSLIHIESRKSPTAVMFDVDTGRISIITVSTKEYQSDVLIPPVLVGS